MRFTKTPAIATRDWSRLYSTQSTSSATLLTTSDARSGKTLATRKLAPDLGVRAVSDDGRAVVLTEGRHRCQPVRGATASDDLPDRSAGRPEAPFVSRARQRRARGILALDALAVRHRVHAPDRARPLPRRPHRPHQRPRDRPSRTRSGATRTSSRSRCGAPHARRPWRLTGVACTRCTRATPPRPSRPSRSCTCSTSSANARPVSTFPPSSRRALSARSRSRRPAPVSTSSHRQRARSPRSTPPRCASRARRNFPKPSTETTVRATVAGSTTLYVAMAGEVTSVDLDRPRRVR